jgi:hypothetical protein
VSDHIKTRSRIPNVNTKAVPKAPDLTQAQATVQAAGQRAGAYLSSWGSWAAEKRRTGWGKTSAETSPNATPVKASPTEKLATTTTLPVRSAPVKEIPASTLPASTSTTTSPPSMPVKENRPPPEAKVEETAVAANVEKKIDN